MQRERRKFLIYMRRNILIKANFLIKRILNSLCFLKIWKIKVNFFYRFKTKLEIIEAKNVLKSFYCKKMSKKITNLHNLNKNSQKKTLN